MMVRVLFYGGGSLLDRLIMWFTRSRFTHTAIDLNGGGIYEELARGLIWHPPAEADLVRRAAVAYRELDLSGPGVQAMTDFYSDLTRRHTRYSYEQLILDAAQRIGLSLVDRDDPGVYVCSGAVAAGLQLAGYTLPPKDVRAVTPADLAAWLAPLTEGAPL